MEFIVIYSNYQVVVQAKMMITQLDKIPGIKRVVSFSASPSVDFFSVAVAHV